MRFVFILMIYIFEMQVLFSNEYNDKELGFRVTLPERIIVFSNKAFTAKEYSQLRKKYNGDYVLFIGKS